MTQADDLMGVRYAAGDSEQRPWGHWEVLAVGPDYIVKRVTVAPGQRLSLQYHRRRSEFWTIVQGEAEVEIDDAYAHHSAGAQLVIPALSRHRIGNPGPDTLVFVEIQRGPMLDEADIIRLSDDYGRNA